MTAHPLWRCRWQASDRSWGTERGASAATSPATTRSSARPACSRPRPSVPASSRACSPGAAPTRRSSPGSSRRASTAWSCTSQSFYASLAHLIARDDGSRAGAMRSAAAQAAVSAGVAVTGAAVHQLLPQRRGEPLRRAVVRNAGRRAVMVGGAGVVVSTAAYLDAAAHQPVEGARGTVVGLRPARRRGVRGAADPPVPHRRPGGGCPAGTSGRPADPGRRQHTDDRPKPVTAAATRPQPRPGHGGQRRASGAGVRGRARSPGCSEPVCVGSRPGRDRWRASSGTRRRSRPAAPASWPASSTSTAGPRPAAPPSTRRTRRRRRCTRSAAARRPGSSGRRCRREGVRFVNLALTRREIAEVTGVAEDEVADPVRAFAGLASAPDRGRPRRPGDGGPRAARRVRAVGAVRRLADRQRLRQLRRGGGAGVPDQG